MSKCAVLSCNDELIWISEVLFNVKWRVNQLHMDQPSLNVCRLPVSPCAAGGVYHYSCFTVSSLCLFVCCILSALFTISIKSHRLSCNRTWLLICKLFIWVWTSKQLNTQTLCVGFVFMGSNLTWTWDESYALVLSDQISTQQNILYMEDSGLRCWTKLGKMLFILSIESQSRCCGSTWGAQDLTKALCWFFLRVAHLHQYNCVNKGWEVLSAQYIAGVRLSSRMVSVTDASVCKQYSIA